MDFFKKNKLIVSVVAICILMLGYVVWTTLVMWQDILIKPCQK